MARKRVVGVVDVDAVRVLQLPLSPRPLQSLPTPLPLHVRPDREEPDQTRPISASLRRDRECNSRLTSSSRLWTLVQTFTSGWTPCQSKRLQAQDIYQTQ